MQAVQSYAEGAAAYLDSRRDHRQVFYKSGGRIEAVTTHPFTGGGIATIADLYEDQLRHRTQFMDFCRY